MTLSLTLAGRAAADPPPFTLTQALDLGIRRAPSLRSSRALAAAARASVDEQRAAYFPALRASGIAAATAARPAVTGDSVSASAAGTMHAMLYDFGKTANAVASAEATGVAAMESSWDAEQRLRAQIASAYVTAFYRQRLQDVAQATLVRREQLAALAKGLVESGLQPHLEEVRAVARAESARFQVVEAEIEARDAYAALVGLLDLPATLPLPLAPPKLPDAGLSEMAAARAADALPSVAAAIAESRARDELVDGAISQYLPSASLEATPVFTTTQVRGEDRWSDSFSATGQVVVTVPLLDLAIGARVAVARRQAASARALVDQTRREVRTEAVRSTLTLRGAAGALASASRAAESAAEVLMIVQARYAQGLSSPLELIDAESADADARVQRTQTELSRALSMVRVLAATGRPITEVHP